jgi:hypothetical protein
VFLLSRRRSCNKLQPKPRHTPLTAGILALLLFFFVACERASETSESRGPDFPEAAERVELVAGGAAEGVAEEATSKGAPSRPATKSEAQWESMVQVEEFILAMDPQLGGLAFSVKNLMLPDKRSRQYFMPISLSVTDLAPLPPGDAADYLPSIGVQVRQRSVTATADERLPIELNLWRSLFERVDYFENSKFEIKTGHFVSDEPREFEGKVRFRGAARLQSGETSWVEVWQTIRWRLLKGENPEKGENWRIVAWHTRTMKEFDAENPLFKEVLREALPVAEDRNRARTSIHENYTTLNILNELAGQKNEMPDPNFRVLSVDQHPAVTVTDIDRDGFDDIYIMARWGKNQMLRNRGDGTFEEVAEKIGLDIDSYSSSAIFADFDNDGDLDLFLGRSLRRSAYFENDGGRFIDRSSEAVEGGEFPYFAASLSATDYDGDGLLDIYVATYSESITDTQVELLPPADADTLARLNHGPDQRGYINQYGPPNVLLRNLGGGRFKTANTPRALKVFRNTYQASWADYDSDGDSDVYLANDFAPDVMVRNDGGGKFTDITEDVGFRYSGFGMSVTWGDYDRDGRQDLYVSNMYSTAGTRITKGLDYLDSRFGGAAKGNYLFRNEGSKFRLVSGTEDDELHVEQAGWSWGSHLFDADNDGFLDLFVLAGFFTAPKEFAIAGDT